MELEVEPENAESEPSGDGHPLCTSAEDCIGGPRDLLVRHLLEGEAGDVYCAACWESFYDQRLTLEGVWEDGPNAGKPYVRKL